jgi:hypothetical protein
MLRKPLPVVLVAVAVLFAVGWIAIAREPFPSDRSPEGAYARVALAMTKGTPRDAFAYLETESQWASYTIRDVRAKACGRVRATYPEPERARLLGAWSADADAPDGADVFAQMAERRGWASRLRRDLSGVDHVEVEGERATIVTARGTRYPFRRRENGIWGLTIFTAELLAESERASRDLAVVEAAARDYERAAAP